MPARIPPRRAAAACLAVILAVGFGLRWRAANHPYISQWDEAYHALVAKNIAAHPPVPVLYAQKILPADDRDWTKAGVWLHKPPLPLWLMAAGIAAFGEGELSFRLPSVVLDTLAILLVYLLALELFGPQARAAGLAAALLYSVNPLMIRLVSGRIPDDSPHVINAFFITLTVYLFAVAARKNSRAYAAAAGLSLGLGTLCMSAVALLGLAAPLPLMLSLRGPRGSARLLAVSLVAFLAAALPWPLYCLSRWPELWRHESALHVAHLFSALDGHAHAWWWYLEILAVQYGGSAAFAWASTFAAAAYAALEVRRGGKPGLASALAWLLIPYVFFSLIATKLYAYVAIAVPAVCLLAGFAAAALWAARTGRFRPAAAGLLLAAGAQAATVAYERATADYSTPPWNTIYDYPSFRSVMLKLRGIPGPRILLNVGDNKAPQAMYYSQAPSYPDAPTPEVVRDLLSRGFRVFVLVEADKRGADVPEGLKTREFRGRISYIPVLAPRAFDPKHPYEA
ncbi:MAG: glycosyltransferase family 39 protein [Elusimicrobiota bacterium]|nr:glycosyltransferase family 39 protein [Elusimicrobiota bacterium]